MRERVFERLKTIPFPLTRYVQKKQIQVLGLCCHGTDLRNFADYNFVLQRKYNFWVKQILFGKNC
jgi:hypothetical protein